MPTFLCKLVPAPQRRRNNVPGSYDIIFKYPGKPWLSATLQFHYLYRGVICTPATVIPATSCPGYVPAVRTFPPDSNWIRVTAYMKFITTFISFLSSPYAVLNALGKSQLRFGTKTYKVESGISTNSHLWELGQVFGSLSCLRLGLPS